MEPLLIIGAGGLGRDTVWLVERMNAVKATFDVRGFVDDNVEIGTIVGDYRVVTNIEELANTTNKVNVCIAIANPEIRKAMHQRLSLNKNLNFPNLIDPSAIVDLAKLGIGNIVAAGTIMTVQYSIEDFCIINTSCTIGHDTKMASYVTVYPGVNISGNVTIEEGVEIGTGSSIKQGITLHDHSIIGAGAAVIRDIESKTMNVGVPTSIKKHIK